MGRVLALIGALIAAALIAWASERPPAPKPATAPPTAFSAQRAMADVRAMGSLSHPVGSAQNTKVRDELVRRMTELGLSPQVRPGVGVQQPKWAPGVTVAGRVENVVGVLPGRDRSAPALALMAHYDSVPRSPGAADDIAGVAAVLEVARALKAYGTPARDVILILTDGEEAGLLGANAFFQRDPLAKRVGFVVNLEARGSSGRAQMFQTGPGNGEAVRLMLGAPRPSASSLAVFIYERMPNDTDFTEARRVDLGGLNFAFAGRQFDYHSPTATPANLDRRSLQDLGGQVLAVAHEAAFGEALPRPSPDLAYSQAFGDMVIAYPPAVGWGVLLVSALLIGVGLQRAQRLESFPWTDLLRGAGAAIFAAAGAAAVLHFARRAVGVEAGYLEQRYLLAQAHRWEAALMLLGLGFLVWSACEMARGRRNLAIIPVAAGVAGSAFRGFDQTGLILGVAAGLVGLLAYGRPVSRPGAWGGVLLVGLAAATAAQVLAPTAAVVAAWPLALASIGAAGTALAARRGYPSLALLGLLAAVGLGWIGGYAHGAYISLDLPEILAAMVLLGAYLVWPLAQPEEGAPPARLVGPILVLAGFAAFLWVRADTPWSARFPQATYVTYHADLDARRGYVVSTTPGHAPWVTGALESYGPIEHHEHWQWGRAVDASPAPFVEVPPPGLSLTPRPDGTLALAIAPAAGGTTVAARLKPDTAVTLESVAGVPARKSLKPGEWSTVRFAGSGGGAELVLRPQGPGRMEVRLASTIRAWPAEAKPLPKRPADVMAWDVSDSTTVTVSKTVTW